MNKFFPYILFLGLFIVYSFFTLPLLLPLPQSNMLMDRYDAIIVLGGGLAANCTIDASLKARMDKAIEVYKENHTAKIILTGGQTMDNNCAESEAMQTYAMQQNVPIEQLIQEDKALNTYQNAYYSINLMKRKKMANALIVTSDFHLRRANFIFNNYKINHQMVAATSLSEGKQKYIEWTKEQLLLCFHSVFGIPDRFGLDLKEQKISEILKGFAVN